MSTEHEDSMKFILYFIFAQFCFSQASKGFVDFNGYYDTNKHSVLTINTLLKINEKVTYFSLSNFYGEIESDVLGDLNTFYSEQNIRYSFSNINPFQLTIQWNLRSGIKNDRLRFGFLVGVNKLGFLSQLFKSIRTTY